MTYYIGEEKPSLEEALEHHGVKGMKWGVIRKNISDVHNEKVSRSLAVNERVVAGQGSRRDKQRVLAMSPTGRLAVRGVKGTAAKNAQLQRDHLERLNTGKATASDLLAKYGGLTPRDIARVAVRTVKSG